MKIGDIYPDKYLKADRLGGQVRQAFIEKTTVETLADDSENLIQKIGLQLRGCRQLLLLNVSNARLLAAALGDDTDSWIGRTIELMPDKVVFRGKVFDVIRVRVPDHPTVAQSPQRTPPASADAWEGDVPAEPADDIPW